MFRLSTYMSLLFAPSRSRRPPSGRAPRAPVVIWNLTRTCNLRCTHCYAFAANGRFPGELTTAQAFEVVDDLATLNPPMVILSGGEPLMRPDFFDIAAYASDRGLRLTLSSNGCLIDDAAVARIRALGFAYVGISLDGIGDVHDRFRGEPGSFDASLAGIRRCIGAGLSTGIRMTLAQENEHQLSEVLALAEREGAAKFYVSHLNYAGRGRIHRGKDLAHVRARRTMEILFEAAADFALRGSGPHIVTGNNDADGVYFLRWVAREMPERFDEMRAVLERWGGNATGEGVANIDNRGEVHPDTMWWDHGLGNVKTRPFSHIWAQTRDPLMIGLRAKRRPLKGRCGSCPALAICNGNTRTRAFAQCGDPWAEDPGCYLTDEELVTLNRFAPKEVAHALADR
ncbi:heme d1 biosynthesis radical SAM protein NirJ [Sulfidibacter corallicola]|uniref:Heme d1 biosynthesis radical SAM protein NirJ n=1 Tax=Sulfidibacter corallicola TaxID=2818388 RepID=A0A8A4TK36_SULCO|nr:heme d1 biosynthesis radical SAM protein NirJ [Sulfidibacter corallicola]QTD50379.1 heme d1 biosynthesis radical SAM protein NirJ [Sulfidibacter corallicola]